MPHVRSLNTLMQEVGGEDKFRCILIEKNPQQFTKLELYVAYCVLRNPDSFVYRRIFRSIIWGIHSRILDEVPPYIDALRKEISDNCYRKILTMHEDGASDEEIAIECFILSWKELKSLYEDLVIPYEEDPKPIFTFTQEEIDFYSEWFTEEIKDSEQNEWTIRYIARHTRYPYMKAFNTNMSPGIPKIKEILYEANRQGKINLDFKALKIKDPDKQVTISDTVAMLYRKGKKVKTDNIVKYIAMETRLSSEDIKEILLELAVQAKL